MRRTTAMCLLTLFVFAFSIRAEEVKVMSYNVENMFDVFDDPYTNDQDVDIKRNDEIRKIAQIIEHADADIVVFQELENEHLLQSMVSTYLPAAGYDYIACQRTNSIRGINLGVISKLPIKRLASYRFRDLVHPDEPGRVRRFARDAMHMTVDAHGNDLHVFNVHLKSNSSREGDPQSMKWRTSEAMVLKEIIRELYMAQEPGALILAMGDFNSNTETRPEQPRPWPATEHIRMREPGGLQLLNDAHDGLAYEDRTTLPGNTRYPAVIFDYIYASPALHRKLVKGSANVVRDPALTQGSDHLPVYASYDIQPKAQ